MVLCFSLEILLLALCKRIELSGKAPKYLPEVWVDLKEFSLEPRTGLAHSEKCEVDADS